MTVASIPVIVYSSAFVTAFIFIRIVPPFPFLVFLVLLFQSDAGSCLQLFETEWVVSQSLHGCLLLLHDGEERVFTDFGSYVAGSVGILNSNKVLVRCTQLGDLLAPIKAR